mgnify:CR=1 FL=1
MQPHRRSEAWRTVKLQLSAVGLGNALGARKRTLTGLAGIVYGGLGAIGTHNAKRMLAYSSIAHAGCGRPARACPNSPFAVGTSTARSSAAFNMTAARSSHGVSDHVFQASAAAEIAAPSRGR